MKPEHAEIGALIQEITAKGFGGLQTDVNDTCTPRVVEVTIYQSRIDAVTPQSPIDGYTFEAPDLIEALTMAVNAIRRQRGEPTLQDEVAALMAEQETHAETMILCGPDACCTCGSTQGLKVERKVTVLFNWDGSYFLSQSGTQQGTFIQHGELGCCLGCGKWYRIGQ